MIITPLLSILIPTKNREEFAVQVVQHILEVKDSRFQVVIYNNSDTNHLQTLLSESLEDSRVKYCFNSDLLSFVDNFSLGISNCDGEFITIIGDDDGINPFIIDVADWASRNGIEAVTPSLSLLYNWPGSGVNFENGTGRLTISDFSCRVQIRNPLIEIKKLLGNGCQEYLSFKLAKAYHGLIKRSVLVNIKNETGKYIGGLSPDIYLSIAASLLIKKVVIIDFPLTISGICKRSGSADSATGKHTGKLEDAPHFRGHNNYKWSSKVPRFYSVQTIWADSALAAIKDLNKDYLVKHFSIDVLSSFCLAAHPTFRESIVTNLIKNYNLSVNSIPITYHLINGYLRGPLFTRFKAIKNHLLDKKYHQNFDSIANIKKASYVVQHILHDRNKTLLENLVKIK